MIDAEHRIVPIAEEHIEGFRECVDEVARERLYLAMLEAPPPMQVREFVLGNIRSGAPAFVAIVDGSVIGWCDVLVKPRPTLAHSGVLGMGVRRAYRGHGIGGALIRATLDAAWKSSLTRVELTVRADNTRAKAMYERFGFSVEGLCRNHMRIDGRYCDSFLMAILFDQA
jgi:RimJ/RimL family protein N-acetyltransferase